MFLFHFEQSTVYYIHGQHKQYIQVDIILATCVTLVLGSPVRKVCFEDLNKGMFLEVQMKHVVKYDVYLAYGAHLCHQ